MGTKYAHIIAHFALVGCNIYYFASLAIAMFPKRVGKATFFCCALTGAKSWGRLLPMPRALTGACIGLRLLRTIVRWPLSRPTPNYPWGTEHHGNVCTARHSSSKAAPTASEWIRLRMACGAVYFFKTVESSFRRMSTTMGLAIWACIPAFLAAFTSSGKVLAVMARMGIDASLRSASERISLVAV